jgi:hypothetical protein
MQSLLLPAHKPLIANAPNTTPKREKDVKRQAKKWPSPRVDKSHPTFERLWLFFQSSGSKTIDHLQVAFEYIEQVVVFIDLGDLDKKTDAFQCLGQSVF